MCGIAGFYGPPDDALLGAMTDRIAHRGPDDEGAYVTPAASLGHRRLSIIDIEGGHQPMSNVADDLHMVYNGELYNFRELREELAGEGWTFSTASDSEVFLRAYEAWGPACFGRFNGMWGVALLDERGAEPQVVLSRDHFGIKPMYLCRTGGRTLFASEIKALLADPSLRPGVDEDRLAEYLLRGLHDHDERTFFTDVRQVLPATYVVIDSNGRRSERYWEPALGADPQAADPERFRTAFRRAVERRLVADVTVGTCLSGGLDSSSIVCTMTDLLRQHVPDASSMGERLRTFSAVFDGDPIDEQKYIEPVLAATGAASDYVRPVSADLIADLPRLVWHQDEPMVSSGPYAQYRVMALAEGKAKVLLDGQAGDELLAGYVPYQYVYLRQLLRQRAYRRLASEAWKARDVLSPLVRQRLTDRGRAVDVPSLLKASFLGADRRAAVRRADERSQDDLKLRLLQDLTRYSLPSLLRYEDRNSMAHSIESRPPFLDQELVELVLSMPADAIVRDGWSRAIFRQAMEGVLPEAIRLRRKKIGFTTPEIRWLRSQRAAIQGVFRSPSFASRPYWDGPAVARAFKACCDGELEESPFFWRVLDIEAWLRVFHGSHPLSVGGSAPAGSLFAAGDDQAVALVGTEAAHTFAAAARPNADRHRFMAGPGGRAVFGRAPLRTSLVAAGDDIGSIVSEAVAAAGFTLQPGDLVAISEKAVAVSQGRSFPVSSIRPGLLARILSRRVGRTSAGIGLAMPETMQLAVDEAGAPRIVLAAAAGALARVAGRRGTFYRIAGSRVSAIDGPTAGTLPPFDTHAKLPPADPDGVASALSERLSKEASGPVCVAVVDANDRGVVVLGASQGTDRELVAWLFGDNPLGQGSEQTPVALIRKVGSLAPG